MRMGWLLGWAIPPAWFSLLVERHFPKEEHVYLSPTEDAVDRLVSRGPFDWITGYSLGSLLLLEQAQRISKEGDVAVLAPIFAFPRELGLGGRVTEAQVKYLLRWLGQDPVEALKDFYQRAGLNIPPPERLELDQNELAWGLRHLLLNEVAPQLPKGWRAWCGERDALLDPMRLVGCASEIRVVEKATHDPDLLLAAMAKDLE